MMAQTQSYVLLAVVVLSRNANADVLRCQIKSIMASNGIDQHINQEGKA